MIASGRLDVELAARGLARSRSHARELIDSGRVLVNGRPVRKAALRIGDQDQLALTETDPYVSRAAYKLLGALEDLHLTVPDRALDAGASTGVLAVVDSAAELGWHPQATAPSRLPGPACNVEYFVLFASGPGHDCVVGPCSHRTEVTA